MAPTRRSTGRAGSRVAVCLLYVAGVLAGAYMVGSDISWAFLAAWSAVFAWCYLTLARGSPRAAISIVIVVTIVCPAAALVAVVWPIHRTWPALYSTLWPALKDRGVVGGLEFLAPLGAALICIHVTRHLRFNVAHD